MAELADDRLMSLAHAGPCCGMIMVEPEHIRTLKTVLAAGNEFHEAKGPVHYLECSPANDESRAKDLNLTEGG
jgi:hypothetical protein